MKKLLIRLLAVTLLLTAVALPLTSCTQTSRLLGMEGDERAEYFYSLINSKASFAASGYMEQTMSMKLDIGDVTYEQVTEGGITFVAEKDDFSYLEQVTTTVWTGGEKITSTEDRGYAKGMMFAYYKEGGDVTRLKSPITPEEYNEFQAELNAGEPEVKIGKDYSERMSCERGEDKTWTAVYEGFTEEGLKPFLAMLDGIEYTVMADHALTDVRLTYTADADLNMTSRVIEYVFEENKDADTRVPEITIESTYSGWNNTILEEYDLSRFTEVEDLRHMDRFLKALRDRTTAEFGSFTVTTDASALYDGENEKTRTEQKVTYKNVNDFEFSLSFGEEGYDYKMDYKKGNCKTVIRDEKGKVVHSETTPMTDAEAQGTVVQLMNSESISGVDLADIKVVDAEEGIYRFELSDAVKTSLNEQYELVYGTKARDFNGSLEVTVKDGKLMSYTYHVYSTLMLEGKILSVNVDMTVTFTDVKEDGSAV